MTSELNGKLARWALVFLMGLVVTLSGAWAVRIEQRISAIEDSQNEKGLLLEKIATRQEMVLQRLDRMEGVIQANNVMLKRSDASR